MDDNLEVFHNRVGQQLVSGLPGNSLGGGSILGFDLHLHKLAYSNLTHALEAQFAQCMIGGLALWIEDGRTQRNGDFGFEHVGGSVGQTDPPGGYG